MAAKTPRRVSAHLDILPFSLPLGELVQIGCTRCKGRLELHQPSLQAPERMLGVCEACNHWFAIFIEPDWGKTVLVHIPGIESVRGADGGEEPEVQLGD